jgi:hypothetical protein
MLSWRDGVAFSTADIQVPYATGVSISEDTLSVDLADGRSISAPIAWFPRLAHGTPAERRNLELIGGGEGIHWPDLDEDISVEGLLAGRRSGESQASLKRWLADRRQIGR